MCPFLSPFRYFRLRFHLNFQWNFIFVSVSNLARMGNSKHGNHPMPQGSSDKSPMKELMEFRKHDHAWKMQELDKSLEVMKAAKELKLRH